MMIGKFFLSHLSKLTIITKNSRVLNSRLVSLYKLTKSFPNFTNSKAHFTVYTNLFNNQNGNNNIELKNQYEIIANETLESLIEKFDYLAEEMGDQLPDDYDATYSNGVLTVKLGHGNGIYVLNKQTPNLQIWLSSPVSGPKRYDLVDNDKWIYRRTGETLHQLLSKEISECFNKKIDFSKCAFSGSSTKHTLI